MYDVAIIGGGIIGGMTARTLSKYNLKICILEKENDVATGATKANSAIVHAGFDAEPGTLKAALNVKGSKMMKKICEELGVKYRNNGSLVLGFDEKDRETIGMLYKRGISNGVSELKIIERDELRILEPNVSPKALFALYAPTGAIVCPYELAIAAIGNAMDNGAELKCNYEVCAIEKKENGYSIFSQTDCISSRFVINCTGIYADKTASYVSDSSISITPRKGEYILLDKECGNLVSHTLFRTPSEMGKGILISPTVDGNLLLGPTSVNIDDKENKNTTEDGFFEIVTKARNYVNNLPSGKIITSFCGLRAVGNTGDFIINSPMQNFINAAGIESPGLSASPAIAEYIADMLQSQGLVLTKKENYDPKRPPMHFFSQASNEEKNRIISLNPSYGKIVCRCEGITEGEVIDAIRRAPGAKDLDGVKRRTRAQMGRCQGGFCSPIITELLSKELNIPFEKITKFGGSSVINTEKLKKGVKK